MTPNYVVIRNYVCRVVDLLKHSSAVSLSRVMPPETWKYTFNFQVQVVEAWQKRCFTNWFRNLLQGLLGYRRQQARCPQGHSLLQTYSQWANIFQADDFFTGDGIICNWIYFFPSMILMSDNCLNILEYHLLTPLLVPEARFEVPRESGLKVWNKQNMLDWSFLHKF